MAQGIKTGGRRKGTPNKTTLARRAAQEGVLPLDVLTEAMRYHYQIFSVERRRTKAVRDPALIKESLAIAAQMAEKAAPYYHQKLSSTDVNVSGRITLEAAVQEAMRLAGERAANGNVPAPEPK